MKSPKKDDPRAKILKALKQLSLKNAKAQRGADAARQVAHEAKAALKKARKAFKKAKKLAREARKELKALKRAPVKSSKAAGKPGSAKALQAKASKKARVPDKKTMPGTKGKARPARPPTAGDKMQASVKASPFPAMAAPEPTELKTISDSPPAPPASPPLEAPGP